MIQNPLRAIMNTNFVLSCAGIYLIALFFSCSSENGEAGQSQSDKEDSVATLDTENEKTGKTGKVFYAIPSPLEMTSLIKKAGASYNKDILNSTENASKYVTTSSMALNLGIYGADLSYSSIFEQTQETMHYFAATKKLADDLGITQAFGDKTLKRLEANINNRDSLISIISDSYWETDSYLKESKRSSTAALVIAGGWIEGLYIATKLAESTSNNKEIVSRVGEQKLTLNNLIPLLETYSEESVNEVVDKLYHLQEIFNGVELIYTREEPTTNAKTKITTLNTTSQISISVEQLDSVTARVTRIRNSIIN